MLLLEIKLFGSLKIIFMKNIKNGGKEEKTVFLKTHQHLKKTKSF